MGLPKMGPEIEHYFFITLPWDTSCDEREHIFIFHLTLENGIKFLVKFPITGTINEVTQNGARNGKKFLGRFIELYIEIPFTINNKYRKYKPR